MRIIAICLFLLFPIYSHAGTLSLGSLTYHWFHQYNFSPYINQLSPDGQLIYNPMLSYETSSGFMVFGGSNSIGKPMGGCAITRNNWLLGGYIQDSDPWDRIIIRRREGMYKLSNRWPRIGAVDLVPVVGYSLKFKFRLSNRTKLVHQTILGPVTTMSIGVEW
jgi:hypothetical protein